MEKHFFVVHTFISDETHRAILTPPEKKILHKKRKQKKSGEKVMTVLTRDACRHGLLMKNFFIVTGSPKVSRMSIGNLSMKN